MSGGLVQSSKFKMTTACELVTYHVVAVWQSYYIQIKEMSDFDTTSCLLPPALVAWNLSLVLDAFCSERSRVAGVRNVGYRNAFLIPSLMRWFRTALCKRLVVLWMITTNNLKPIAGTCNCFGEIWMMSVKCSASCTQSHSLQIAWTIILHKPCGLDNLMWLLYHGFQRRRGRAHGGTKPHKGVY